MLKGDLRVSESATRVADRLRERNRVSRAFFPREAGRLAAVCRRMAERFLEGGRLIAFGRGPYSTDAQHVSVEFIHPIVVGKRALPALDVSLSYRPWLAALLQPQDMVMGFGPPGGDPDIQSVLDEARTRGALTFALPGRDADYAVQAASPDPFVHQEMLEILYHTLWETVHVFFEHRERGHEVGAAGFLYPFLGAERQELSAVADEVAASIVAKAQEDERLREAIACDQGDAIARTAAAISERVTEGGKLILFGNGGSATDANDWALDCVMPPEGYRAVPAISLALEPANLSAIANDVGPEVIFLRQLIAHARPGDVAVGISTSGNSGNVIAALEEARTRGLGTVALVGYEGGEILRRGLADFVLVAPSDYIPRIQEAQASIYHVIRADMEVLRHGGA
jgi:D-sedoheptulose 7-phosphate isomerase